MSVRALVLMALLLPVSAQAQQRICSTSLAAWSGEVEQIELTLQQADFKEAKILVEVLNRDWECLDAPVPAPDLLRYAQARAFLAFHAQDPDGTIRWSRAAEYIAPGHPWPAWIPEEHPVRSQLEYEDPTEVVTVEGKYPNHPKKGAVFLNGAVLQTATAPVEVPVFVQVFDKSGAKVIGGYWQEGAEFREGVLTDSPTVASAPKWFAPAAGLTALGGMTAGAVVATTPPAAPVVAPEPVSVEPEPEPEVEPEALPEVTVAADLTSTTAPARSAADCPAEPVTVASVAEVSHIATEAFARTDRAAFDSAIERLRTSVPCLSEIMLPVEAAELHRLYAFSAFVDGNDQATLRGFQVSLALDPAYELPGAIAPAGGPLASLYERGRENTEVSKVLYGEPAGMSGFVDGRATNKRPISAPAFIQLQTSAGDVHWSAYLTPEMPLPEWLPSAKEALLASVGEDVVKDFAALRVEQEEHRVRLQDARAALLAEAEAAFGEVAGQARTGSPEGRSALEGFVGKYDAATVTVDGRPSEVVVPQVAAARAWLNVYEAPDAETVVAEHAQAVQTARTEVRTSASGEWKRTEKLIAAADYGGQEAVTAFVSRYEKATVEVADATERVFVPEVDVAKDWAQIYTLADEKIGDTSDSLKVVLEMAEERQERDREVMKRISTETAALMVRAREDWAAAKAVAELDRGAGEITVRRFIAEYSDASIEVGDERVPVEVPELPEAQAWLDGLMAEPAPAQPVSAHPHRKRNRFLTAVGLGMGAGALYGTSWGMRKVYDNNQTNGTFWATNGTYLGAVALGTSSLAMLIAALATPKDAKKVEGQP